MGIFDFLFKSSDPYEKTEKTLTNMYVQPTEREYIISQLRDEATPKACQVLLARFSKNAPNTTVDQKEKELVYQSLVMLGQETDLNVVEIVKDHLRATEERINWPLRILSDLMSYEDFTAFLAELLSTLDTTYQRDPEKKHELLLRSMEHASPELASEVVRFLEDMNDTVRFAAIRAAFAQEKENVEPQLIAAWKMEDSVRNSKEIGTGFVKTGWVIEEGMRDDISEILPEGYKLGADGKISQA